MQVVNYKNHIMNQFIISGLYITHDQYSYIDGAQAHTHKDKTPSGQHTTLKLCNNH